jgi:predicted  nucleic acid-binding Zn-ribbon protein
MYLAPPMEGTPQQPPASGQPGAQRPQPAPAAQQIEELRARLDDAERRLKVRTYAAMVVAVLGLAAGIVALILAMQAKDDAATESDLQDVREQIASLEEAAGQVSEEDLTRVTDRVSALEDEIEILSEDRSSTRQRISVIEDDIQDLRDQIADLETGAGGGAATPEEPGTPGTETP